MVRRSMETQAPGFVLATLGGAVASTLALALMHLGPALGLPALDVPTLLGGAWTRDAAGAFWSGHLAYFLFAWLVLPLTLHFAWEALPGGPVGFGGALPKGLLLGAGLWVVTGLLVGVLSRTGSPPAPDMGFFALGYGASGFAWLLAVHLAYGAALALVSAMGQGLSPLDATGWMNHGAGHHA